MKENLKNKIYYNTTENKKICVILIVNQFTILTRKDLGYNGSWL